MADHTFQEQLTTYPTGAHAIEAQALEQMKRAPGLAGDPDLAEILTAYEGATRVALAGRILGDEHAAAERVAGTWDAAVDATLQKQLV